MYASKKITVNQYSNCQQKKKLYNIYNLLSIFKIGQIESEKVPG